MRKLLLGLPLLIYGAVLIGCENNENNDLLKAQDCLDHISASNYAAANGCISFINSYDSQQANILKCAAKIMAGGLTTQKVANAYKKIAETGATSKEATFISVLALNPSSRATEAQPFCERSGMKSLVYISNLAVVGSMMFGAMSIVPTYDPTDPTSVPSPAEVANMIAQCQPPNTCNGQQAAIGTAVATLSDSYCSGANATTDVCTKIGAAVAGSGGDPTLVTKQLFCTLDGKTYNPGGDNCI